MQLEEWLKLKEMSQRDFCRKSDIAESRLSRILSGQAIISLEEVCRIKLVTKSKVKDVDWLKKAANNLE